MTKKSSNGSDGGDGRRNNRPPKHGQIKNGEVRNPDGRRGKPPRMEPTAIDELLWELAKKIVAHDKDGPVEAVKRLIQDEFHDALVSRDPKARARLFADLKDSAARLERNAREHSAWAREAKAQMIEEFEFAEKMRRPAPDALHPDHVEISSAGVRLSGPVEGEDRIAWEWLKAMIRITACIHDLARQEYRRTGSLGVRTDLEAIEKHRRWLMRKVPKGWEWKEEIYCRGSQLEFALDTVRRLKEIGYVPSEA